MAAAARSPAETKLGVELERWLAAQDPVLPAAPAAPIVPAVPAAPDAPVKRGRGRPRSPRSSDAKLELFVAAYDPMKPLARKGRPPKVQPPAVGPEFEVLRELKEAVERYKAVAAAGAAIVVEVCDLLERALRQK